MQCWRPNRRPPTVPQIRPLTSPLPMRIPTLTPTRRTSLATVTAAAILRLHRVALIGILPVVVARIAGHHLPRPVLVGTSRVASAMTAAHHRHLAPGGMTTEWTTGVAIMAESVGVVSRIRGPPLVGATTARVSVRRRHGRACWTATATAITTAEETTHGTDTGIAGVDGNALIYGLWCPTYVVSFCRSIRVYVCAPQKICSSFEYIFVV